MIIETSAIQICIENRDNWVLVTLSGAATAATASLVRNMESALYRIDSDSPFAQDLVIDLRPVTHLDESGVQVLTTVYRRRSKRQGEHKRLFALVIDGPWSKRINVSVLPRFYTIHKTIDSAIRSAKPAFI